MGSGKTTVGRSLAASLNRRFVDTDAAVEARTGKSVSELFSSGGESAFRSLERDVVLECLAAEEPLVIALGGGSLLDRDLRHQVIERATVVVLSAPVETLARRLQSATDRPLLAGEPIASKLASLQALRAEAYAECHGTVDTHDRTLATIVDDIKRVVQRHALVVPLGRRSYVIEVGQGWQALVRYHESNRRNGVFRITDANVARALGGDFATAFGLGEAPFQAILEPGEERKSIDTLLTLWQKAQCDFVDRGWSFWGVGGGVVTDITGFLAATWLRGVPWVSVPTSLLGMVDAAIGGKTGVDLGKGKNAVGAVHQPSFVYANVEALRTEPERSFRSGFAEVVKTALLHSESFFSYLEESWERLLQRDPASLTRTVSLSASFNARVVGADEHESGLRSILNLGHTFGHALEATGKWTMWRHGEAVAIGLVLALRLGVALGVTAAELVDRVKVLLTKFGLPVSVSRETLLQALPLIGLDKKRSRESVRFVLVESPGRFLIQNVSLADLSQLAPNLVK
jgi:3-dehydroquinate synthase